MAEHYNIGEKALVWAGGVALAVLVSAGVASCNDPELPPRLPSPVTTTVESPKPDPCLDPAIGPYAWDCPQFDPTAVDRWLQEQPPIENYDVPDVDLDRPGDGGDGIDINWCRRWWC